MDPHRAGGDDLPDPWSARDDLGVTMYWRSSVISRRTSTFGAARAAGVPASGVAAPDGVTVIGESVMISSEPCSGR